MLFSILYIFFFDPEKPENAVQKNNNKKTLPHPVFPIQCEDFAKVYETNNS